MATTRIMPLHIGKGRTESQAVSDIIDYVSNPVSTPTPKVNLLVYLVSRRCSIR